jgi:hypothetical protein
MDDPRVRACGVLRLRGAADRALAAPRFRIRASIAVLLRCDRKRLGRGRRSGKPGYRSADFAFYYRFLPPMDSFAAKRGQFARFPVFIVSAALIGSLSLAQRRATESLRRTRDDLRDTVQKLKETNYILSRSEAYLAGAEAKPPGQFRVGYRYG